MSKLENCMMDFTVRSLKNYLGPQLVDTLIEWTSTNEALFTKKRLINMILKIQGNKIFKNPEFRRELLGKLSEDEIVKLGDYIGSDAKEPTTIIEKVCGKAWGDNVISRYILELFDINPEILFKNDEKQETIESIANSERFFELLDYQFYIKQRLIAFINDDQQQRKRILVQMPTGTGKTKTVMHTITNYYTFTLNKQGLIIWMAHTNELLSQAYETFKNVWSHIGNGKVNIYKIWGDADIPIDQNMSGIAFCGIAKLSVMQNSNPELFDNLVEQCRLIVFDEAHKLPATETSKMIKHFMEYGDCDRTLVGLTATPGRTTQNTFDNQRMSNMFDNRLLGIDLDIVYRLNDSKINVQNTRIEPNIIQYFQNQHVLARIQKQELIYQQTFTQEELKNIQRVAKYNGYKDFDKKALETIGRNKSRNIAIMNKLRMLYSEGRVVIVFTCSVEQAKMLSAMLELEDIPNSLVLGEMSKEERETAIRNFKDRENPTNIIINYEVLTTGFDSSNINCVFIARPTQSVVLYSQMLGRGLRGRRMGGNDECLLIDVKDNLTKFNEEMAFTHFEGYWEA